MVDRGEHLRPRAVVLGEREHAARLLAPLAEDLDVGVAEAVDGLELVADEEELLPVRALGEQVDDLALEPVRVLELVDHDRAEAPALALPHGRVVAEQVARGELEILEVERRLAVLRRAVGDAEPLEELLEEVAVAGRQLVERRLLDARAAPPRSWPPARPRLELAEVEQALGQRPLVEDLERAGGRRTGRLPRLLVRRQAAALPRAAPRAAPPGRPLAQLEAERTPGGAQRLVDAGEHPAERADAVGREQAEPLLVAVRAEVAERLLERLALEHARLRVVEDAEARVDAGGERVRAEQAVAEAVDRRDPGGIELARQLGRPASTSRARMRSRSSPAARSV